MSKIDKKLVEQRFARSLHTYSHQAVVQQQTAEKMVRNVVRTAGNRFANILEIGCGTGVMTRLIEQQLNYKSLLANDLAPQCSEYVSTISQCHFTAGDIEKQEYPQQQFDLIISNATFQWLDHLGDALNRFSSWLKPGGIMAFSTFGPENIKELAMLGGPSLNYLSHREIINITQEKLTLLFEHEDIITLEFSTPWEALRHLKETGVNSLPTDPKEATLSISTKSALLQFTKSYIKTHSTPNGVSLTYHPVIIIAKKS